jgi:hypothetical protein
MRKLLLGFAVIFALAGCDEGQESALFQCEFSALSTYVIGVFLKTIWLVILLLEQQVI